MTQMTQPGGESPFGVRSAAEDDPQLAFIYQEALRGLLQQSAAVESLRNRPVRSSSPPRSPARSSAAARSRPD
jgi:hypothetical protein